MPEGIELTNALSLLPILETQMWLSVSKRGDLALSGVDHIRLFCTSRDQKAPKNSGMRENYVC